MTVIWFAYGFGPTEGRRGECWADLKPERGHSRVKCVWSVKSCV